MRHGSLLKFAGIVPLSAGLAGLVPAHLAFRRR